MKTLTPEQGERTAEFVFRKFGKNISYEFFEQQYRKIIALKYVGNNKKRRVKSAPNNMRKGWKRVIGTTLDNPSIT